MTDTIAILKPDKKNRRKHNERNIGMIVNSLQQVGASRSIVIDEDNNILAGNGTVEAAQLAGIERMRIVDADGEEIIAVRRTGLTDEQKRRLALYDNRTAEIAEWNLEQILEDVNEGLTFDGMFGKAELDELLRDLRPAGDGDAEPQIDKAEELNEKWGVVTGDLWQIGSHRLLCGDSTKREDVERVMQGDKATVVFTDPPYRMETQGGGALHEQYSKTAERIKDIVDFNPSAFLATLQTYFDNGYHSTFIFCNKDLVLEYLTYAKENKLSANILVWHKPVVVPFGDSHRPDIEYIIFFRNRAKWINGLGDANYSRCLDYPNQRDETHPTVKPLELVVNQIRITSENGDVVGEPFCGSGTTMVACERLKRKCRAIEISPNYCAVILERMATAFPVLEIQRVNSENGES